MKLPISSAAYETAPYIVWDISPTEECVLVKSWNLWLNETTFYLTSILLFTWDNNASYTGQYTRVYHKGRVFKVVGLWNIVQIVLFVQIWFRITWEQGAFFFLLVRSHTGQSSKPGSLLYCFIYQSGYWHQVLETGNIFSSHSPNLPFSKKVGSWYLPVCLYFKSEWSLQSKLVVNRDSSL